jgi:hypothetical protein
VKKKFFCISFPRKSFYFLRKKVFSEILEAKGVYPETVDAPIVSSQKNGCFRLVISINNKESLKLIRETVKKTEGGKIEEYFFPLKKKIQNSSIID